MREMCLQSEVVSAKQTVKGFTWNGREERGQGTLQSPEEAGRRGGGNRDRELAPLPTLPLLTGIKKPPPHCCGIQQHSTAYTSRARLVQAGRKEREEGCDDVVAGSGTQDKSVGERRWKGGVGI